ncbi:MAG TPA: hypothetical protein VLM89_07800 [Phycisphaerae bacterium]|nr:hypothetical protein [Phycisphaerae bacterium]
MADYVASARSNYFRVKDVDAFQKWLEENHLGHYESQDEPGRFMIFPDDGGHGDWPTILREDPDTGEEYEADLFDELAKHLHDEDVAVLMEAGAEKLRYVSGWAVAVNSKGDRVEIGLSDIYEKAKHLGKNITEATY